MIISNSLFNEFYEISKYIFKVIYNLRYNINRTRR